MPEYRQDPLTGEWVIIAPERSHRPLESPHRALERKAETECPFCPGNEHMLAPVVREWPSAEWPGWTQRAVCNRFPALVPEPEESAPHPGVRPGRGRHWVLIDSPFHDDGLAEMPLSRLASLLWAYRDSFRDLAAHREIRFVSLFRNRGGGAGASLDHPHSQLLATDMLPPATAKARDWQRARLAAVGECAACRITSDTLEDPRRLTAASEHFTTLVPFAPRQPLEQLVLPRRHAASFAHAGDAELRSLAETLQTALRRLDALMERAPCNISFESALPDEQDDALHWHVRIVPRISPGGGFEQSAGMAIVPASPEQDAARLREAMAATAQGAAL